MVGLDSLASLDATEQAELVRSGTVSPLELVDAAIERIERVNRSLNAVVIDAFDQARKEARREVKRDAPLAGVPFLLKDLLATCAGMAQTESSRFLQGNVATHDSTLVSRFRKAGLVIVGKTNTPEFGNASTTEPALFGPCRNPWQLDHSPGGSSGGSAAAVASLMVPAAHGSDGGGSIRVPASCCGVFGFKPTRGRNPLGPRFGDVFAGLYVEHVLTRSVRDSALFLDQTTGPEPGDPYLLPAPRRPFVDEAKDRNVRLKLSFSTRAPSGEVIHPDTSLAVSETAALCRALGHEVDEASPQFDFEALERGFFELWADGTAWSIESWTRRLGRAPKPGELEPLTRALWGIGRKRTAADHLLTVEHVQAEARKASMFFQHYDAWLTPTVAEPPPLLGAFEPSSGEPLDALALDGRFSPFTYFANVTGQPAMSVPLAWNSRGLPVGVHFIGRFGEDASLFRLAAQLEEARPWCQRLPPTSALTAQK